MQLSLDEYVLQLKSELKPEPEVNNSDSYNIQFKYNDILYERRFKADDKIADLKIFVKMSIKTFNDIELCENFPRKIFNDDYKSVKEEGISKRQILYVKLK